MERGEESHRLKRGGRERDSLASVGDSFRAGSGAFKAGLTHFSTSVGSRSTGQSAAAKYDYINREGKYAKGRENADYKESGNLPEWAKDNPRMYWESADESERANGRLFVQAEFALPRELSEKEQVLLAREQTQAMARTKDGEFLPYSFAIHDAKGHNPHFHLIISERILDEKTRSAETWFKRSPIGAKKTADLQHPDWVKETRREWCDLANKYLATAGAESRLDHRTLKEQGIDREPTVHVGYTDPTRPHLRQQRQARNETVKRANALPEARKDLAKAEAAIAELKATLREIEGKAAAEKAAASMPEPDTSRQVHDLAQPEIHAKQHGHAGAHGVNAPPTKRHPEAGGLGAAPPVQGAERPGAAVQQGAALPTHQPGQLDQVSVQLQPNSVQLQPNSGQLQPNSVQLQPNSVQLQPEAWEHGEGISVHCQGIFAMRPIMDGSGQAELLIRQKDTATGRTVWKPTKQPCVGSPVAVMREAERRQELITRIDAGEIAQVGYRVSQDEQGRPIAVHPGGLYAVRPENPGRPGQFELLRRVDAPEGREAWSETGLKAAPRTVYAEIGRQMERQAGLVNPGPVYERALVKPGWEGEKELVKPGQENRIAATPSKARSGQAVTRQAQDYAAKRAAERELQEKLRKMSRAERQKWERKNGGRER